MANDEIPIPFSRFAPTLVDTHDEVFTHLLRLDHGTENHTPTEWRSILDQLKKT